MVGILAGQVPAEISEISENYLGSTVPQAAAAAVEDASCLYLGLGMSVGNEMFSIWVGVALNYETHVPQTGFAQETADLLMNLLE
jgi:hypothetical protein